MMIEARCNRCRRSTIDPDEMDYPDDMPQPDGRPCGGTFIVPPGPLDLDVHPRRRPDPLHALLSGICPLCELPWRVVDPSGRCDHEADYYREWLDRLVAYANAFTSEEAVTVLALHFGANAWLADPPEDARDALRDLLAIAVRAQNPPVSAPHDPV